MSGTITLADRAATTAACCTVSDAIDRYASCTIIAKNASNAGIATSDSTMTAPRSSERPRRAREGQGARMASPGVDERAERGGAEDGGGEAHRRHRLGRDGAPVPLGQQRVEREGRGVRERPQQ